MPPGSEKRKAAHKKKKAKANKKSSSSTAHRSRHGESDGGKHKSHPAVKAKKKEDDSSGNESLTIEKQDETEIDTGSNSDIPQEKNLTSRSSSSDNKSPGKKKPVVIEPAPAVDLVKPLESSPEKGTHKVENLAVKTPPFVDPVKHVDHSLVNTNHQEKNEPEKPLKPIIVNNNDLKNNHSPSTGEVISVTKENKVQKSASPNPKNNLPNDKCLRCGRSDTDGVIEPETPECSERRPLLASTPCRAPEKTSWKSCCGIFELFSGSSR